jgi:hypothetical protein
MAVEPFSAPHKQAGLISLCSRLVWMQHGTPAPSLTSLSGFASKQLSAVSETQVCLQETNKSLEDCKEQLWMMEIFFFPKEKFQKIRGHLPWHNDPLLTGPLGSAQC